MLLSKAKIIAIFYQRSYFKEHKMQKTYFVTVIGGGFSGLITADVISSAIGGENVLVVEKNDRVGKKILATGNGRGNLTNLSILDENYHSVCGANVGEIVKKYGNKSIIDYFNSLGVAVSSEDGKVYPSSFQANSLLDALRQKLEFLKTEIAVGEEVTSIEKKGKVFKISTNKGEYFSYKVIFASSLQFSTNSSCPLSAKLVIFLIISCGIIFTSYKGKCLKR
jgi:predicted flavoprotein YhiN